MNEEFKKRVGVVICGVDDWERDIIPLLKSIYKYEPDVPIKVVTKEEPPESFFDFERTNLIAIWNAELGSYAQAINRGVIHFLHDKERPEWLLIMNGDVLCDAPFVDYVNTLDNDVIYGNKLHNDFKNGEPLTWVDGWIYAIPTMLFLEGARFDENFLVAGFEDADFCFDAFYNHDYDVAKCNLPFTHLKRKVRREVENYDKIRLTNLEYLRSKWDVFK